MTRKPEGELDLELDDLPAPARWREWMGRVEAAIFAAAEPVLRENLARVVGKACSLELLIDDIRDELRGRPYEIVSVAGGWMFRTKLGFGESIRTVLGGPQRTELTKSNALVLMAIGYFQPITRGELSQFFGREVSRDTIAALRGEGLIAAGCAARPPARPTPMSPRRRSSPTSVSNPCATCPTSRSSRTPDCSVGRARRFRAATPWRPSWQGCWGYPATKTSRKTMRLNDKVAAQPSGSIAVKRQQPRWSSSSDDARHSAVSWASMSQRVSCNLA